MKNSVYRILASTALLLALVVVVLGAYTRLTQAGLGCPDWPGCYGHMILQETQLSTADVTKAWTEMVHRYAAGTLATLIVLLGILRSRYAKFTYIPYFLMGLVAFQAALGMWTVTWKLLPIVVMGHLLGGLSIVACLGWLHYRVIDDRNITWQGSGLQTLAAISAITVFLQIALGGWVSANYAGISCVGFPLCNGQWIPDLNFQEAFRLFSPIGENYQGGLLDPAARMTIQWVHRLGAILTVILLMGFSYQLYRSKWRLAASLVAGFVLIQFLLGIANVVWLLPMPVAVLHNAVAALLLATVITLNAKFAVNSSQDTQL